MNLRTSLLTATALVATALASSAVAAPAGDAVTLWNANAGTAATKACITPNGDSDQFHESRMWFRRTEPLRGGQNGSTRGSA